MTAGLPPIFCIIGRKNSGKTGLTVSLAAELNRRGHKVMTVKHGHSFQLDQPGKDSWRHRHEGGAVRTVLSTPGDFAIIGGWPEREMTLRELVGKFLWDADLVLAEGFKASVEPKIEVLRGYAGDHPLTDLWNPDASGTLALVTDAVGIEAPLPILDPNDPETVPRLADLLEAFVEERLRGTEE